MNRLGLVIALCVFGIGCKKILGDDGGGSLGDGPGPLGLGKSFEQGAREDFARRHSCPDDRIAIKPRNDIDSSEVLLDGFANREPPAEIAADPERLAKWQEEQNKTNAALDKDSGVFEVEGCDHHEILSCRHPAAKGARGQSVDFGRVTCIKNDLTKAQAKADKEAAKAAAKEARKKQTPEERRAAFEEAKKKLDEASKNADKMLGPMVALRARHPQRPREWRLGQMVSRLHLFEIVEVEREELPQVVG